MWIEETKSGKYKYVEEYVDYMTGKRKRVSVTLSKDTAAFKRKALEDLTDKINERQSTPDHDNMTLRQLVEKYREYQAVTVKKSTYQRNYFSGEALKKMLGEDVLINRLTAQFIKEKFLGSKKEPGTLNELRTRLNALLNWGFENDYVKDVSFLRKFKPFNDASKREKIQDKFLESDEITTLLEYMKNSKCEYWYLTTKVLLLTGMRIGEFVALLNKDVDLANNIIHITKTYDAVNKYVDNSTKTLTSTREVYIQPELKSVLKEVRIYSKKQKILYGYDKTDIFLPSTDGQYIKYYSYNKFLKESSSRCLGRKIIPHTLRHTHVSILAEQGVSLGTISRRVGHADSKVTKDIYLHITKNMTKHDNEEVANTKII